MSTTESSAARTHILEQATALFVANGYRGISMREIAAAAGMSKAGIYYHFADKEQLFLAILAHNLEQLEALIEEARAGETTTRARLRHIVRAICAQAPTQRALIRLASQEMLHLSQDARVRFGRLYEGKFIGPMRSLLQEGIERGELRPMEAGTATWILLGMLYPFLGPSSSLEQAPSPEAIDLLLTIFFEGAAMRGERDL